MGIADQEVSHLRCAATWCLVCGILYLPGLLVSVPAIVTGSVILCCGGPTIATLKGQLGCARCSAITGIIFAVLTVIASIVAGALYVGPVFHACEVALGSDLGDYNIDYCAGRRLEPDTLGEGSKPAPRSSEMLFGGLTVLTHGRPVKPFGWAEIDKQFKTLNAPALRMEHGRDLQSSCLYTYNGVCDDGGPGSEHSICSCGTDVVDCGRDPSLCPSAIHSVCASIPGACYQCCSYADCINNPSGSDCDSVPSLCTSASDGGSGQCTPYQSLAATCCASARASAQLPPPSRSPPPPRSTGENSRYIPSYTCATIENACNYAKTLGLVLLIYPPVICIVLIISFSYVVRRSGNVAALSDDNNIGRGAGRGLEITNVVLTEDRNASTPNLVHGTLVVTGENASV